MPESSPGVNHCGTAYSGWLHGQHPEEVGLEVEMEACFDDGSSDNCSPDSNKITVTKCNDGYYVYHLVDTPSFNMRYCATNEN